MSRSPFSEVFKLNDTLTEEQMRVALFGSATSPVGQAVSRPPLRLSQDHRLQNQRLTRVALRRTSCALRFTSLRNLKVMLRCSSMSLVRSARCSLSKRPNRQQRRKNSNTSMWFLSLRSEVSSEIEQLLPHHWMLAERRYLPTWFCTIQCPLTSSAL